MKTTTEMEIKVSGGRILEAFVEPNGSCKLTVEVVDTSKMVTADEVTETKESVTSKAESQFEEEYDDNIFVLVEASKLSLDDEFMTHKPTTNKEKELKKLLTEAIKKGLKNFYRPVLDPSFNDDGSICYIQGKKPAVVKYYMQCNNPSVVRNADWWKEITTKFMPERGSRLGNVTEYIAFLGVLLKKLIKSGWSKAKAWDAVCNDSKELGHYWDSENAKREFETTGSREIVGFYDLANTFKILMHGDCHCIAGGYYDCKGNADPLSALQYHITPGIGNFGSVGWLVLEK